MDENKCPICGKPFEPREFNALGTKRIIYVAGCDCKQKAKEAELAEKEKIRRHRRAVEHYKWCDIGERLQECWLDNFDVNGGNRKMFEFAKKYIDKFPEFAKKGIGAVFEGPVGVGKTHLAVSIFREITMKDYAAIFIRFTDLVTRMQEARNFSAEDSVSDLVQYFNQADFCVLDDVGSLKPNDGVRDFLYKVIDGRYQHKKPTLVTTNFNEEQMKAAFGDAIYDRLIGANIVVSANGNSERKAMRDKDIEKILGAVEFDDGTREKRKTFEEFLEKGKY